MRPFVEIPNRVLETGSGIRIIQKLLGRTDVSTTMSSTPVLTKGGHKVRSPGDALCAG